MNETEIYKQMEQEIFVLAAKYSLTRLKISTHNFDRDFKLALDGSFQLVSTKAIIRVLGKTTKVPIGEGQEYETYEEAYEATKKHWSEYYREVRAKRSEAERRAEALRQKRYRDNRKRRAIDLKQQQ